MSIFKAKFKTFKSDILGEVKEFKINNAIWVIMQEEFGMTQREYSERAVDEEYLMGARFVTSVLKANGYETTEEEVVQNTSPIEVVDFIQSYNKVFQKSLSEVMERHFPKTQTEKKEN